MKKWLDHAWFNFTRLFQWHRVLGVAGLCVVAYVLVFYVFGNVNVGGLLPPREAIRFRWPDLPSFLVRRESSNATESAETVYTVPTRQITAHERAEIPVTNQTVSPARPR